MIHQRSSDRFVLVLELLACVVGACCLPVDAAAGEGEPPFKPRPIAAVAAPTEETRTTVFRLEYANGDKVVEVIESVLGLDAKVVFEGRSNSLIVVAPASIFERVEELIEVLDVPPDREHAQRCRINLYRLRHVDPTSAVGVLEFMLSRAESTGARAAADRVRVEADEKNSAILVYGPPEAHVEVKEFLDKLDVPAGSEGGEQVKVFSLDSADATTVAKTVSGLFEAEGVKVAVDARTNSIVTAGSQGALEVIEAILLRLEEEKTRDRARQRSTTFRVRIVWLASGLSGDRGTEPAEDLKDVLDELSAVGVTGLRQVGQTVVNTTSGGHFEISCVPLLDENPATMAIRGKLDEEQETPHLEIQISGKQVVHVPTTSRDGRPGSTAGRIVHTELIKLDTEIAAPRGQYVVLGATPAGKMTSVFVVQVTSNAE